MNFFLRLCLVLAGTAFAQEKVDIGYDSEAGGTLIHLFDYLAQDYSGAVSDGTVIIPVDRRYCG